jgi:transcriptional regulator with XRE-family HTH domain
MTMNEQGGGANLRRLIQERLDEGWSSRRIARQANLSASTVGKLLNRPRATAPKPEVLVALARGLQMPEARVFAAAAKDWTTPPNLIKQDAGDGSILVIASQLEELPAASVQQVKDLTDMLFRRMKEEERRRANG